MMHENARLAIDDWVDEVCMLAGEDPDFAAVQVMTEELFDAAPVIVLLAVLADSPTRSAEEGGPR